MNPVEGPVPPREGNIPNDRRAISLTAADLPLHCPLPSMSLWNSHPRVFLPIEAGQSVLCPYCGTRYTLEGAAT
jgi:uncharacterized Zn-finger protein